MSKRFNEKFKGIMRYLHITPKDMDEAVKILNEPEPRGQMHPSQLEDITVLLQRRWEEIEKECKARGHKNRKEYCFNYCHIQVVNLCKDCYELGQEEHVKLYNKLISEGYKP